MDGKTYWWCEQHYDNVTPPRWSGLYVTHKPEDHDQKMAFRRSQKQKRNAGASGGNTNGNNSSNLVISQKLKEVLCSKLMVSDADADGICNDICGQCGQGKD